MRIVSAPAFRRVRVGVGVDSDAWTRVYLTRPLEPLLPPFQQRLAAVFAELIETLEPLRRAAMEALRTGG